MMYKQAFVAAILVNNQALREEGEIVKLPFGSEYSILLKNLNPNQRAIVKVFIDGSSVASSGIVVNPNSSVVLERAIDDNMNKGRKFKFIERTGDIEAHRGIKSEDGLVRIEFQYELRQHFELYQSPHIKSYDFNERSLGPVYKENYSTLDSLGTGHNHNQYAPTASSASVNQVGITGKGSVSNQSFTNVSIGVLESTTHQIIFQLLGRVDTATGPVELAKPVTVRSYKVCNLCGRKFDSTAQYCSHDGNALELSQEYISAA